MTQETIVGALGGVLASLAIGLVVWGFGIGQSVGDLDARTRAINDSLTRAAAQTEANARQIGDQGQKLDLLAAKIDLLVTSAAEDRAAMREDRQAARVELGSLRELTLQNATAIRDLLYLQRRPGALAPGQ